MDETIQFTNAPTVYVCPHHGEIGEHVLSYDLPVLGDQRQGAFCLACWMESLDRAGVSRATKKDGRT